MKIQQIGLLLIASLATQGIQSLGDVAEFKRFSQLQEEEEEAAGRKMPTGLPKTGEGTVTENPYAGKHVVFHRSISEPGQNQPRQSIHYEATPSPISSRTPSPTPPPLSPMTPTKVEGGIAENQPTSGITRRGSRMSSIQLPAAVSTIIGERGSIKKPSLSTLSETTLVPPTAAPKRGSIIGRLGERLSGTSSEGKPLYPIPRRESIIPGKEPAPLKESALIEMRKSRNAARVTHGLISNEYKNLPKAAKKIVEPEYSAYESTAQHHLGQEGPVETGTLATIHRGLQGLENPSAGTVQKQFQQHQEEHARLTDMQQKMLHNIAKATELAKPQPVQAPLSHEKRLSLPATTPGGRRSSTFTEAHQLQHLGPSPIPTRRPSSISVGHETPGSRKSSVGISH